MTKTDIYLDKIERHAENIKKYNFKTSYGKPNEAKSQISHVNDKVDNSVEMPFFPLIKSKPNALTPLPKDIIAAQNDPASFIASVGSSYTFPHPYESEISNLQVKNFNAFTQSLGAAYELDKRQEHKFEFIETKEHLINMCEEVGQYGVISIDTEYHSEHSFQGYTCLIQVY